MDKSSKAITLALIGSAAFLGGCNRRDDENNQQAGYNGGRSVFIAPRIGGGGIGGGTGGGVSSSPSARGGFGSTGSSGVGSFAAGS